MKLRSPINQQAVLVCVMLAAVTLAVFWPVRLHDFINFDDQDYLTANAAVSYVRYLRKILWPDGLAICYPLVRWEHWQVWGAVLLLLACAWLTLQQLRYWQDSASLFTRALACNNDNDLAHDRLGDALLRQHKLAEAKAHFLSTLQLAPRFAEAHYGLGLVLQAEGHPAETVALWRTAIGLKPAWMAARNNLAWLLATCSESSCRNPAEAVSLAERACQLTDSTNLAMLATLAAAYA